MEWLKEQAKKLLFTLLGIAAVLTWWTIRGPGHDPNHTYDKGTIPSTVWEGGGNVLEVVADATVMSTMRVSFQGPLPDKQEGDEGSTDRFHEAWQKIEPGHHTWSLQFPVGTKFGLVELGAEEPKVGDKLNWQVKLNQQVINQDTMTLEKPLEKGYAMFLQVELDEFLHTPGSENTED